MSTACSTPSSAFRVDSLHNLQNLNGASGASVVLTWGQQGAAIGPLGVRMGITSHLLPPDEGTRQGHPHALDKVAHDVNYRSAHVDVLAGDVAVVAAVGELRAVRGALLGYALAVAVPFVSMAMAVPLGMLVIMAMTVTVGVAVRLRLMVVPVSVATSRLLASMINMLNSCF